MSCVEELNGVQRSVQSVRDQERNAQLEATQAETAAWQAAILQHVQALTLTSKGSQGLGAVQADHDENTAYHSPSVGTGYVEEVDAVHGNEKRQQSGRLAKRRKPRSETYHWRISFASWLTGRIWDFAATRSQARMGCGVTTWNLVPWSSPIFSACERGDLNAVKELLSRGSASPTDVTSNGSTLLSVSR